MEPGAITLAEEAPAAPGVYFLYRGGELTYIGLAEQDVQRSVDNHRSGACAGCARQATGYTFELTHHPRRRHRQHVAAFRERAEGRTPACNDCQPCGA